MFNKLGFGVLSSLLLVTYVIIQFFAEYHCYSGKRCFFDQTVLYHWQVVLLISLPFLLIALFMLFHQYKKRHFKKSNSFIILICSITLLLIGAKILKELQNKEWQEGLAINISSFSNSYSDKKANLTFRYPNNVMVEDWGLKHNQFGLNIRWYHDQSKDNFTLCSLSATPSPEIDETYETIVLNGITWKKKAYFTPGWNYAFNGFKWETKHESNFLQVTTDPVSDKLCESILSTIKL